MNSTTRKQKTGSTTFSSDRQLFINRELSWLNFNSRVLDEADIPGKPVLDRLKFISIFSSNLDEFFMVRIAGLHQLISAGVTECDPSGLSPAQQLKTAGTKIAAMVNKQYAILQNEIIPELKKNNIFIHSYSGSTAEVKVKIDRYFKKNILPVLTPRAVDPQHPFPLLNSGTIELACRIHFPKRNKNITAIVEVPEILPRFIKLPGKSQAKKDFFLLEDVISGNISELFPGGIITGMQFFRLTRDMDYHFDPDESEDLIHVMLDKLKHRSSRSPVRLEFSTSPMNESLQKYLVASLQLGKNSCYNIPGALHLKQWEQLIPMTSGKGLTEPEWKPVVPELFSRYSNIFNAIAGEKNILLAHPYQSFNPILQLLQEAADDPDVVAIKQTLYRVSGNSPVIKALKKAAENGKQVTVLVELKARFDESNNIAWAELLDLAGAHVIYGISGLKVHSKALLIIRREKNSLRRYVHLGTGNYNDRTAEVYTDLSLLSCDENISGDTAELFNLLSGCSEPPAKWSAIYTAPFNLRKTFIRLINNEISLGKNGRIIAKMNSFSDPELIRLIHKAANTGVKIDLIVRGICCLRPDKKQSNLRIISIVDRFLEHSRIFYFGSGNKLFCSSADWMPRNLDRRIETMFPITDPDARQMIMQILNFHLLDRDKCRRLLPSGNYSPTKKSRFNGSRSQHKIYSMFCEQKKC